MPFSHLKAARRAPGSCVDDIIGLSVAGVDCVQTITYISSKLIKFVTRAALPGRASGPVVLTTRSGGSSEDVLLFYYDPSPPEHPRVSSLGTQITRPGLLASALIAHGVGLAFLFFFVGPAAQGCSVCHRGVPPVWPGGRVHPREDSRRQLGRGQTRSCRSHHRFGELP